MLYTPQSGQYGPMRTRVISATASEAPYVLDGLHPQAHRTSLHIAEHYTVPAVLYARWRSALGLAALGGGLLRMCGLLRPVIPHGLPMLQGWCAAVGPRRQ